MNVGLHGLRPSVWVGVWVEGGELGTKVVKRSVCEVVAFDIQIVCMPNVHQPIQLDSKTTQIPSSQQSGFQSS